MSGSTTYSLPMLVLLVLVLLHPAVAQVPTVTTTQTSYSVNQGATVTIGCNVQSTTTVTTVFWQRNVGGFITTINVAGNLNKYSGGSPTTPSLTIANAANDDSGIYTCFAANAFGTGSSSQSDLAVIIPNAPTITVSQGSYSVLTGNSVTLGCSVTSATTVTDVYWQRTVGNTVTVIRSNTNVNKYQGASVGTPSLTILNADSGDSGNYVCYAVNAAGTSRSPTTTLSVTSNTLPTVTISQNAYTANGGSSVTLGCSISSSTTITDVYWTRTAGGTVTTIRSSTNPSKYSGATSGVPSLTISNLNSNDAGNYVCFGTNSVGTSQSNVVTLTVNNLPTVTVNQNSYSVNSGGTIQLVCSVSSTTTVNTVFWTRVVGGSSTTIFSTTNTNKYQGSTPSVPSLTILNADSSDAGTYTCSATNAAGTGQSSQTILTVNQLTLPTVTISQNAYTANSGSSITLACSISSTTTITDVYWRKTVGGTFTDIRSSTNPTKYTGVVSGNPSLTISNVDSNDAGNYVCYGTNNAGTAQSGTTTLTVISQSVPSVSISQPSYSVLAGGSIQLACTVSSTLSVTSVYWQRNVGGTITRIDSTTNINKYSGSTPTTPSLTILNAAQSDAGTYQCFATNSVGTGQSPTTTTLTVSSVPTVQVLQNSYSGSGGSNIVLQCTVSSSSSSVTGVYWQRNVGGTITRIDSNTNINKYSGSTVSTPSLTINNLDASDAGLYTCFATNNAGTGQSFATTLTVFSNPPTVTVAQSAYSVTTGQQVTLVCTVTSSTQVTNVFWQRNVGGTITTIQSNSNTNKYTGGTVGTPSLTILNTAQSDVGQYTCFASNSAGTGQSAPTTLSVTGNIPTVAVAQPSYSATTGQSVTLDCTVTSTLQVNNVYWTKNVGGGTIVIQSTTNPSKYSGNTISTPSLTILNSDSSDTGVYQCYASNSAGTGFSTTTTLTVTGSPPTVTIPSPIYSTTIGQSVTLTCSVSSTLTVNSVYWQRTAANGNSFTIFSTTNPAKYTGSTPSNPSLTISNADSNDAGTYTCFATNSAGTGQSTTTSLSVTGSVPTVTVAQPSYSTTTGQSVTLVCTVSSTLSVNTVYWQRNVGGTITTIQSNSNTNKYTGGTVGTPSLTILNTAQSDVGSYTCFASNSVGTGQSSATTLSVTGTVPSVTVQQPSYSVNTGQSVTLVCNVFSNLQVTNVFWQRNSGGFISNINSNTNTNKYSGSTVGTPSLTILNADQNDAGVYTCFATNSVGTGQSTTTTLSIVSFPPTVAIQQPSYSISSGQSVTLVCSVTSTTQVTSVQWQRSVGGTITTITSNTNVNKYSGSTVTTPSLTILNVVSSDAGQYTCFASNSAGTGQSSPTTLTVLLPPIVNVPQPFYSVTTGQSVTLSCTVTSTLTVNNVYWQKNVAGTITTINSNTNTNKYSGSTTSTPSLTIFNSDSNDAGSYTCFADNSAGTGQSSATTLSVTGSPPAVTVAQPSYGVTTGQSVTLVCTVTSTLAVNTVYWTRNDGINTITIQSNSNTNKYTGGTVATPSLTILNAAQSDVGQYTCFASNSVGTGQSSATTLSVTGSPPAVTVAQPSYGVTTGQSVTLVCTVTSTLAVNTVYWTRNDGINTITIQSNSNTNKYTGGTVATPSLTILNAAQSDVGQYTCFASNSVGTGQSSATTLSVTGSPPTVTVAQPSYGVTTGQSVTLVCTVTSTLAVNTVYWTRNDGINTITIQSNSNTNKYTGGTVATPSLTILNAAQSDVGQYICFASNSVGTGQSSATTLSVTGSPPTVTVAQPSYGVTTGQSVTLVCTVTSTLAVNTVYWTRNDGINTITIQSNSNTNKYTGGTVATPSLTILNAAQSDVGQYTCFATNIVGTGQSTATSLSVTGVPPTVNIPQPSYSVNVGNTVTLDCTVTSTLPVLSVTWQKNSGGITTSITSTTNTNKYGGSTSNIPSLTINLAESGDSGTYTCTATNIVGTGQSNPTTLTVNENPPVVRVLQPSYSATVGNPVTLECRVTSSLPVTSVYWQRNVGGTITTITSTTNANKYTGSTAGTPSLTVTSTQLGDTGSYTCFASNSAGTGQSTATTLTVTGTPPTVTIAQPTYSVTLPNSVTLECTISSVLPVTNVEWQRNIGGTITTITSSTNTNKYSGSTVSVPSLTISTTELADTGSYICTASNSVGTGQSTATTLTVTGTPPTVTIAQPTYSVTLPNSVTLECTVSSVLPVTNVEWQRNIGGTITTITSSTNTNKYSGSTVSVPSLTISTTELADTGSYICTASNSVGTGQSTATTLTVTGTPPTVTIAQPTYSVTLPNSVTLECTVSSVLPVTNVEWQRNIGGTITTITSSTNTNKYSGSTGSVPSLTISTTELADTGSYICTASNSVGTGQSTATTLTVTGTPPTVTIAQPTYSVTLPNSVTLECTVSSVLPVTNVEWQRNIGGTITTITSSTNTNKYSGSTVSVPSLTISTTELADTGSYICTASNSVGTGQSTATTLTVTGTPPTVTVSQPTYSVTVGDPVTLECTVTSVLPVTNVEWQRNIGGTITSITSSTNTNKYSGSTVSVPSLTISTTELADTGSYICTASNSVGTGQSTATTLTVTGTPPTVTISQPTYSVTVGNFVVLECTVSSMLPVTKVEWKRDIGGTVTIIGPNTNTNKYTGSTVSIPSLTILAAELADTGRYTCTATNSVGTGESTATTLTVMGTPPTVTILQPSYSVTFGGSVTLECTVSSLLPVTNVEWQRNIGGTITTITSSTNTNKYSGSTVSVPSLTISATEFDDSGNYTCFATNSVGTGQSADTELTVTGTPPVVTVAQPTYSITTGQSITLGCTVSSILPVTSVYWQSNINGAVSQITTSNSNKYSGSTTGNPSLTIFNANANDAGSYTCFATNSVGTGQSTPTSLSVTGSIPTVTIQDPTYSVLIGNSVTLVCSVSANPLHTSVVWQRVTNTGNVDVNMGLVNKYSGSSVGTPSLTINNADNSDSGNYICTATNIVGTGQSQQTTLSVTGNIPVVRILSPTYSVTFGGTVTLECTVSATPTHTSVQWRRVQNGITTTISTASSKYSGAVVNSPSLSINNADLNDNGEYICTATNIVGTGQSSSTVLTVTGNPPTPVVAQNQYSVLIGNTITLVCTVTSNPAATSVSWQLTRNGVTTTIDVVNNNNKYGGSTINVPSLTIFNAANSDQGDYICRATNQFGTGTSQTTTLTVTGSIPTVQVLSSTYSTNFGTSKTLECVVTANPLHTVVQWRKQVNNQFVDIVFANNKYSGSTVSNPSLTVNSADLNDEGYYICTATNSLGTGQSAQTFLDVIGNILTVTIQQNAYSAIRGSTVTLGCTVSGSPGANTVFWQRTINNVVTTINSNTDPNKYSGSTVNSPSLTINNAQPGDEASYVCFATNVVGTGQSQPTFLTVTGSIPVVQILQSSYSVNFGGTVTLDCTVTANPTHTSVQWQRVINGATQILSLVQNKHTGATVSTPSLTISAADLSDEGNYICTATNSIGTGQSQQTFLDVVGSALSVQIVQSSYSVLIGQSRTLECLVSGSPSATSVYWQKIVGGSTTTINSNTNTNKYSGSTVSTPSLTILNAEQSDEANYVCYAVNAVGTANSQQTFLDVTGNIPSVVIQQPQYSVLVGNSITLVCTVTANPTHTSVNWRRTVNGVTTDIVVANSNNKYSGSTVSTPSLTINNAAQADEGNYVCYASNSIGTGQSSQTFLDVFGGIPTVVITNPSYTVNIGNTVTLGCSVSANPTETNVYWRKTQNGVSTTISVGAGQTKYSGSTVKSPSLQIFNVDQSDQADYVCYATNSVGTGNSAASTLNVLGNIPNVVIPQNQYSVNFGDTITIPCQVTATPGHTSVEWRRTINGVTSTVTITGSNRYSGGTVTTPSLTISGAANTDEGFYTCYATNSVGTGNSIQTYLDVVGNPPVVQVLQNQYSVLLGNQVTLQCTVTANPTHTSVQWTRVLNGNVQNIDLTNSKYSGSTVGTPSLTITGAQNSDEGYYTCTATNIAGTGTSQQTYLDVTGNIPIVTVSLPNYNINTGQSVTLGCTVTANPTHTTVYWQRIDANGAGTNVDMSLSKYSGSTVSNPSLTINNVALSDEGSYRCYATNSIGTGQSQNTNLDVLGNIPIVQVLQSQYSVNIGNSRTLECTVTANPVHTTVYWQRIIGGVSSQITIDNVKYSGSTVGTPSLTINNAANSDEGFYVCFATNSIGTGQSANTYLDVVGSPPVVNIPSPTFSVNFGDTVTLTCTVTANPTQTNVYWQKVVNGVATTITVSNRYSGSTVSTPSLTISNAQQSDEGFYVCYATNSIGTGNSQQTFLDVIGNVPIVRVLSNTYSTNVGTSITLECEVTANPTHTSVQWIRVINGVQSTVNLGTVGKYSGSTVNVPSLTINNAANSDEGYYICQATNTVGTGKSSQTYLDVIGSVLTVVVAQSQYSVSYSQTVTLVCTVSGTPSATSVYWQKLKNGQTTTINQNTNTNKYSGVTLANPSLTISNADSSDAATYTCFGVNSIGTGQSQQTQLSILGNIPTAQIQSNQYSVIVGGSVTIQCVVTGNPAVTSVQWTRLVGGNTDVVDIAGTARYSGGTVNSPSLVISNAQNTDEGYYTCSATNIVGTGTSQQSYLDITGSPPIVNIPQSQYSVTLGDSVTLVCTVNANPAHTNVRWVKTLNNVDTDITVTGSNKYSGGSVSTPSLTISSAASADGGYYTCYASNSVGTGQSQSTFLNVVGNTPQVNILSSTYSVNVGSSVTLQCVVSANPQHTTVYWKKIINGNPTNINLATANNKYSGSTVTSPSLVINNAEIADEGYYECYADNSVGTGKSSQTFLDVLGNVPIVNVAQLSYQVNIGNDIELVCTITSNPAHTTVYWHKIVSGTPQPITVTGSSKYSGSTLGTPSLTIRNAVQADAGSYRCLADNSVGTGQSQITILNVLGNVPTVVLDKSAYSVPYGDTLVIQCTITSSPAHTSVYWQRISNGVTQTITVQNNNKYAGSSLQVPSLTIFNADGNDEGDYICFATNAVGTGQSGRGTVDVTGSVPNVRILKSSYTVQRGNPVTLECEITGTPAHTSVYWTRIINGNTVTLTMTGTKYGGSTPSSPSLIIFNAADNDEGSYICHATNGIGTGHSSQTVLNVEGFVPNVVASITPTVNVGDSVVIQCIVTSDPKETSVSWQKVINNVPTTLSISANNRYSGGTLTTPSLTIANVEDGDEGQYICQATNSVGTGSSNPVYLDVVGDAPRLTYVTPTRITVPEGQLILATCVSTANPAATYQWFKDNSNQVFATGAELKIQISKRSDMGVYKCRASNNYGSDDAQLTVDVQYKPDVTISTTTSTFQGTAGGSINIPCRYVANPAVTGVSWKRTKSGVSDILSITGSKYGGGSLSQPSLTIYSLGSDDIAEYQCLATNVIGTGESEKVTLNVDTRAAPFDIAVNPVYVDVVAGDSFEATCTAKGDPSPTFSWYYSNRMIQTGPKLTVKSSVSGDDGLYTCVATNSLGMAQATMDANVRFTPISTVTTTEFKRAIGDPITLVCSTRANPAATEWVWTKDGTTLPNHNAVSLLVDMDSTQDLGTYSCVAKNTVGQSSIIEFHVKQQDQTTNTVVNVKTSSGLDEGVIAAIVVGCLLAIALVAIIIICCFSRGICKSKDRIIEVPVQPEPRTTYKEPVYLKDVSLSLAPQYKSIEYVQQEPQYLRYDNTPRYYQESQYLPAVEYLNDYDEERRRRRKKKTKRGEQVVMEERVVYGGDVMASNDSAVYRTVERPSNGSQDVYIETQ